MSGPRSINLVSLMVFAALAGGGYWVWKFFPCYYTAWEVDRLLADAVAQSYTIAIQHEPDQSHSRLKLIEDTRARVVALGVTDPEMTLDLTYADQEAEAVCDYRVVVEHPVQGKISVLEMHRRAKGSLKRINWDDPSH